MIHESAKGKSMEYFTPKYILEDLGPFDLDVCTSRKRPFDSAKNHFEVEEGDALGKPWAGFVWCNPPYGVHVLPWVQKMIKHNNGIMLVFSRTETKWFFEIWENASDILFIKSRFFFYGTKHNSGNGMALVGFGDQAAQRLYNSRIKGKIIKLK